MVSIWWWLALACSARRKRAELAYSNLNDEVCQTLGKALGYPWYKDDQKNFPNSTEAQGVCVGDHVAESLAVEAARHIKAAPQRERELIELTILYCHGRETRGISLTDYLKSNADIVLQVESHLRAELARRREEQTK